MCFKWLFSVILRMLRNEFALMFLGFLKSNAAPPSSLNAQSKMTLEKNAEMKTDCVTKVTGYICNCMCYDSISLEVECLEFIAIIFVAKISTIVLFI